MEKINELFESVAGLESIKNELLLIYSWFKNCEKYEKMNIDIPKGVLAYGAPGTGKTYVMREYSKLFEIPVFEIDGASDSAEAVIDETFKKAREEKNAIIFIDEIDLLIGRSMSVARALQTCMDGFRDRGNVIVLATANNKEWVPEPLCRKGRFDRLIKFVRPSVDDIKEMVKFYVNRMSIDSDIDYEYIGKYLLSASCSDIVAIINDACLRKGCKKICTNDLEKSFDTLIMETYNESQVNDEKTKDVVAIHEASHCVLMNKYHFNIYRASILKNREIGGCVRGSSDDFKSMSDELTSVDVCIAGYIGTKLFIGEADKGSLSDLKMAINTLKKLVNSYGYKGLKFTLSSYRFDGRNDSEFRCHRNEMIAEKVMKQRERIVTKYLRKNKETVLKVAKALKEKGVLNRKEIIELFK